jgi:hypothetical protein
MRLIQATTLSLAAAMIGLAACASSGARASCAITQLDSVYVGREPVYEACGVDRKAKLVTTDLHPDYRPSTPPSGRSGCFSADAQFVVDTLGKPEPSTVRITKTNDQAFAEAMLGFVTRLRYEPAMLAGKPVRQIQTEHRSVGYQVSVQRVPAGSAPTPPSRSGAGNRGPTC